MPQAMYVWQQLNIDHDFSTSLSVVGKTTAFDKGFASLSGGVASAKAAVIFQV
jgi:hypothetical protein